jgi:hypothetical protein
MSRSQDGESNDDQTHLIYYYDPRIPVLGSLSVQSELSVDKRHEAVRYEITQHVMFPSHVTSTSAIEKGKWLEWHDAPERTDSSRSNGPVVLDLDLDNEESFIIGRLVSTDVIEHETDHALDYGDYGVMSGCLALS